jgi:hypothetical protein
MQGFLLSGWFMGMYMYMASWMGLIYVYVADKSSYLHGLHGGILMLCSSLRQRLL